MRLDRAVGVLAPALAAVGLAACGGGSQAKTSAPGAVKVETVDGQHRVVLSPRSAHRIGIRTARAQRAHGRAALSAIPYAALLYTAAGKTFAYVETAPLVYSRTPVKIKRLTSRQAFVSQGPAPGASVVTVGGQELYGTETGIQEPE